MTTSSSETSTTIKLVLTCKVSEFAREIISACFIPDDDGFISISSDRSLRVWLRRESGRYWPSVCRYVQAAPTALYYDGEKRKIFVGLDDGTILEFDLSEDFNSVMERFSYGGHIAGITCMFYSPVNQWILSTAQDRRLSWNSTANGHLIGSILFDAITTSLTVDEPTGSAFVGDSAGKLYFVNVAASSNGNPAKVTTLAGHAGAVNCLSWNKEAQILYSGSADNTTIIWDIGGKQGKCYELTGQKSPVHSISYDPSINRIISAYENGVIVFWRTDVQRELNPTWKESDTCQRCAVPFFWNIKSMWEKKVMGQRQHHCRQCGRAVCDKCSSHSSVLPIHGYEIPVRLCEDCSNSLKIEQKKSLASFTDVNHPLLSMDYDKAKKRLLSVGFDRAIKCLGLANVTMIAVTSLQSTLPWNALINSVLKHILFDEWTKCFADLNV